MFSRIKRRGWYNVIKRIVKPKLGDAPVVHPNIIQEDSSIKALGCPRHPLLHRQTIRSFLVKLYFNSVTSYVIILKVMFVFVFVIFILWIKWILPFFCVGEIHAPLFLMNTHILHLYSLSILEIYWGWTTGASPSFGVTIILITLYHPSLLILKNPPHQT